MAVRLVVHSRAIVVDLDSIQKWSLTVARVLICELGNASAGVRPLAGKPGFSNW
jgi:hypothetical protein